MVRALDAQAMTNSQYTPVADVFTDYDGDEPYGDFTVTPGSPPTVATVRSFEPGLATFEWSGANPDASSVKFYHTDHLGTTRFMTDASGSTIESSVYSTFGVRVAGTNHRYGYDGGWGYQSHSFAEAASAGLDPDTAFPFLHVGHRYYDPSTGRFLQRDPIGIRGGLNVYVYVSNSPVGEVDALGLLQYVDIFDTISGAMECVPGATRAWIDDMKRRHILKDHPEDPYLNCPRCQQIDRGPVPPPPPPPAPPPPPPAPPPPWVYREDRPLRFPEDKHF